MKFYNRTSELAMLAKIEQLATLAAQMTFVVGRRRIGKTSLISKAYAHSKSLYFFVSKKSETLLCAEFTEEIKRKLEVPIFGEIKSFKEIFALLMELSKSQHFTLIIDEFQEFNTVNAAVFSDMQHLWDAHKDSSKINLVLCGSVYSLMTRIFEGSKEPLFGRATHRLHVKAFDVATLAQIMEENAPGYAKEDLLAFYLFTGGVAKYVELLLLNKALHLDAILEYVFTENSLFIEEGKHLLIEEFGKEYGIYFSILSLIASGKTSRPAIESILETTVGGHLDRLENDYGLIKKIRPILAKPNSRMVKYTVEDNFLNFWFRFIFKHRSAIEIGNLAYIKELVVRDYPTFCGRFLEKYFIEKLKAEKSYNLIGTYWERDNQNEIDIVAINELSKRILIAEVKRNPNQISLPKLKEKAKKLLLDFNGYEIDYQGLSLRDM
ncbi:MAG: ATP-binding protein [Sphingobacteriaceae bacterium]|nr:ATP-binding protein [Sphingobacteriaceae bacterium]